ncbi:DNA mismatch repair ATPase msh1 [Mortierella sp. AM989]|nr:DNA mismatch repair ATPase msh1 [Mortierella sp. AM989]
MHGACRHQSCIRLGQAFSTFPQSLYRSPRRGLVSWVEVSERSVSGVQRSRHVATNCSIRYHHTLNPLRPSAPHFAGQKKSGNLGVASIETLEPETIKRLGGAPKKSILSLDDLLSVNPNPVIFPIAASAATTVVTPVATYVRAESIGEKPAKKQASKLKINDTPEELIVEIAGEKPVRKRTSRPKISDTPEEHSTEVASEKPAKKRASESKPIDLLEEPGTITAATSNMIESQKRRLTPLRKQILELEATYPDCVLLVRVGEFYELYDHNAVEYGHLLGLKMGAKVFAGQSVPFTGFPVRNLDRYLEMLVGKHRLKVALCEQFQDDQENGSRLFRRSVHRIVTPGTLIDEQFLNQAENNWLLAVSSDKTNRLGLSWLDLSTGDFFTQETTLASFENDLARIRPREIILNSNLREFPEHKILQATQNLGSAVVSFEDMRSSAQMGKLRQNEILKEAEDQLGFDPEYLEPFSNREQSACLSVLRYVNHTQMGRRPVVQQPIEWQDGSTMKIDKNTIEALELVRTLRDAKRIGSLVYYLDRTKTQAGSRLLVDWLTSPLTNIEKINKRLDMVEFFSQDSHLMNDIDLHLTACRDAQRCVQKLSLGRFEPHDLVSIRVTLESLQSIKNRINDKIAIINGGSEGDSNINRDKHQTVPTLVQETVNNINALEHICTLIHNVVDESGNGEQEYGFINEGVSPALNDLHTNLRELKDRRRTLLDGWKAHLGGMKPFEIKSSFGYRHVVEMRNTVVADRLRELVNGNILDVSHTDQRRSKLRYQVPILSEIMDAIDRTEWQIIKEEKSILSATREEILEESTAIVQNCRLLAQLDVLLAFSKIKIDRHYIRPILNNRPNMGGKSTFLRQNAIMTIMAQMGCFVPAVSANLGIVDKVFSRIGSSDNLANSQSTFMVEMAETALILQHATEKSLVIMDEVGRGTATLDGCAIAYATLHHLYHVNKCRTLFATHYHELADMAGATKGNFEGLSNDDNDVDGTRDLADKTMEQSAVKLWRGQEPLERVCSYQTTIEKQGDGSYIYIHNVVPGVCRQSHGIHVAKLAGMPKSAIDVSEKILRVLQAPE